MTQDASYLTAKELREKFNHDLFHLQLNCEHPSSKWMSYMWAPGHYWGEVLVCEVCEKILDRKTPFMTETYPKTGEIE
jgi:hypothetical protein